MKRLKLFLEQHRGFLRWLAGLYRILFGCRKKIRGRDNRILLGGGFLRKSRIQVNGDDNQIEIEDLCVLENCRIYVAGSHNRIRIGRECRLTGLELWLEDNGNQVVIGNNTRVTGRSHMAVTEGTRLSLGSRCLLASEITVRTGDSHSLLDGEWKRCNPAADVTIGDHVWIGDGAVILKGVTLGADCVIGARAVVTRAVPERAAAAGNPARIVKEDITWESERI